MHIHSTIYIYICVCVCVCVSTSFCDLKFVGREDDEIWVVMLRGP